MNAQDEEHEAFTLFRNSSMDDLRFELKRLQQRYDVLERDKKILEDEREIAHRSTSDPATMEQLTTDLKIKNAALLQSQEIASNFAQKHRVVLRHLWLEKRALREMKAELARSQVEIFSGSETVGTLRKLKGELDNILSTNSALIVKQARSTRAFEAIRNELVRIMTATQQYKSELNSFQSTVQRDLLMFGGMIADVTRELSLRTSSREQDFDGLRQENAKLLSKVANMTKEIESGKLINCELSKDIEHLRERHERDGEAMMLKINALSEKNTSLTSDLSDAEDRYQTAVSSLDLCRDQLKRLSAIHAAVQNDLEAALSREQQLRAELVSNGSSKDEVSTRLKRIQEKVNKMESDHSEQLSAIKAEADRWENAFKKAQSDGASAVNKVINEAKCVSDEQSREIEALKQRCGVLEGQSEQGIVKDRNTKIKMAEQDNMIISLKARLSELDGMQEECRNKEKQMESEARRKDVALKDLELALSTSECDLRKLREELVARSAAEEEKEKALKEKVSEIARLNIVVRKECQERTELLIQLSELKDAIRDGSVMSGKTPLNIQSKSNNTTYAHMASIGGLSQEKISSSLVASVDTASASINDRRLADALQYSRDTGAADSGVEEENPAIDVAGSWAQRLGGRQQGGRGRKSNRGHHR